MRTRTAIWILLFLSCFTYLGVTMWGLPMKVPVRFGFEGVPVGWFGREDFITWMLVFLFGLNVVFSAIYGYLAKAWAPKLIRIPWRRYWLANERRQTEAVQRLRNVTCMTALLVNATWLLSYHLVMQEVGVVSLKIPINFAVYLVLVGALVLVYGTINYFKPP